MSKRICNHLFGVLALSVLHAPTKSENILMINLSLHFGDIIISSYSRGRFGVQAKTPPSYRSEARVTLVAVFLKRKFPESTCARPVGLNRCPAIAGIFFRLARPNATPVDMICWQFL